jgi:hypothetical protein
MRECDVSPRDAYPIPQRRRTWERGVALALLRALVGGGRGHGAEPSEDARRAELHLLRILPKSAAWEKWLHQSGEGPPDFAALPRQAGLPNPLRRHGTVLVFAVFVSFWGNEEARLLNFGLISSQEDGIEVAQRHRSCPQQGHAHHLGLELRVQTLSQSAPQSGDR